MTDSPTSDTLGTPRKSMVVCRKCNGSPIMDAIAGPYNTRTRSQPVIGYQVFCIDCDNNSERGDTEEAAEANWEKENAK
jgi:hypothetical protein